jgi:hypothetical protein
MNKKDGKKDDATRVMTTYISREICFHISGSDCLNEVWKKLKKLLEKANETQVMQLEKELISFSLSCLFKQN